MKNIQRIEDVIDLYENFIFDIWGVIHNGERLYEGVLEVFSKLKSANKNYFFISNAPRPKHVIWKKFKELGLHIDEEVITTSGDFFLHEYCKTSSSFFANIHEKCLVLGEETNHDLLKGISFNRAQNIEEASYLLLLMFANSEEALKGYDDVFSNAISNNLPAVCPNPDKIVIANHNIRYPAGSFAKRYEELGGKVFYFGKPYVNIYNHVFNKFNLSPSQTVMIGDSMETDIKGANNAKIDSLLIQTGVYNNQDIVKITNGYDYKPTYLIKSWS